jgi:hypothetical protein
VDLSLRASSLSLLAVVAAWANYIAGEVSDFALIGFQALELRRLLGCEGLSLGLLSVEFVGSLVDFFLKGLEHLELGEATDRIRIPSAAPSTATRLLATLLTALPCAALIGLESLEELLESFRGGSLVELCRVTGLEFLETVGRGSHILPRALERQSEGRSCVETLDEVGGLVLNRGLGAREGTDTGALSEREALIGTQFLVAGRLVDEGLLALVQTLELVRDLGQLFHRELVLGFAPSLFDFFLGFV